MSFAHDIVMVTDDGTPLITPDAKMCPQNVDPSKPKSTTVQFQSVPNGIVPNSNLTKPANAQQQQYNGYLSPTKDMSTKDYKDPLRELVLISEAICTTDKQDTMFLSNVKTLAKQATTLDNVKEIQPAEQIRQEHLSPVPLKPQPKTLTLFKDPKEIVDPVKEREFLKKLEALDETDSEAFDGNSLLVQV